MTNTICSSNDTAFVVVSCDKYSVLWEPFFKCLSKYWKDCPFDKFLINNHLDVKVNNVRVINVGDDVSYSDNLREAIKHIKHKWIILWLDDVFIAERVDNNRLLRMLNHVKSHEAGYLKLAADMPMSYEPDPGEEIGPLPKGIKYRSAIGCALYKKTTLLDLLTPNSSAWDLDKSNISNELDIKFYALSPQATKNPPIKYVHLLIKGRWLIESIDFLRSEGFEEILAWRDVQSYRDYFYKKLYLARLFFYKIFKIYWK